MENYSVADYLEGQRWMRGADVNVSGCLSKQVMMIWMLVLGYLCVLLFH